MRSVKRGRGKSEGAGRGGRSFVRRKNVGGDGAAEGGCVSWMFACCLSGKFDIASGAGLTVALAAVMPSASRRALPVKGSGF
jgi:hypothetical protein